MKVLTVTFLLLCLNSAAFSQTSAKTDTDSKKEAERLWELTIEAKGGREKMETIENLLISSTLKSQSNKYINRTEKFYVFPNKTWEWEDYRPSVLGLTMKMYNWETGKKYIVDPPQKIAELKPIEQIDIDRLKDPNGNVAWTGLVIYILESKWWKPIPEATRIGKINGQKVDIIQTTLNGKKVDFFLDQKSHLPVRISFHNFDKFTKTTDINSVDVSDYVETEGFSMPSKLKESDGMTYDLTYQFNVEYNEAIFTTPPPFEDGREAWRVKSKP